MAAPGKWDGPKGEEVIGQAWKPRRRRERDVGVRGRGERSDRRASPAGGGLRQARASHDLHVLGPGAVGERGRDERGHGRT